MSIQRKGLTKLSLVALALIFGLTLLPDQAAADRWHDNGYRKGGHHHAKHKHWEWHSEREYWRKKRERQRQRRLAKLEWEREWRQWERERRREKRYRQKHGSYHNTGFNNQTIGGVIGGLLGGLAGNQFGKGNGRIAATIGGTILGAVLGSQVAKSMEERDHQATNNVLEHARTGETNTWTNPRTGTQFSMTPERTFKSTDNRDCRDYSMWVFIDGYEEQVKGTACRTSTGKWIPVQS